jgi:AraC family transcriptional regulator of adaptative response/methylated-DNA-[protein]-cysteine methyltransferase
MENLYNYERIEKAIHFIQTHSKEQPSLDEIASHLAMSKFHFQRLFQEFAGVSPKTFLQFLTYEHAKTLLAKGHSTLSTSYQIGLSSNSRLHDLSIKMAAVPAGLRHSKKESIELFWTVIQSPFGNMIAAESPYGLCHLRFFITETDAINELQFEWPNAKLIKKVGTQTYTLSHLFSQSESARDLFIDLRGTAFQLRVWEALIKIPAGMLRSYGQLAKQVESASASRAVGSAIGKNPIAYLIPCHRVIRETANLGGYRWGLERKSALIAWESAMLNNENIA